MATKNRGNVIGFDPLAWMNDAVAPAAGPAAPPAAGTGATADAAGDAPLALGECLTVEQVGAVQAELGRRLAAASVVLEAGALRRLDAAGLQLLAAFVAAATARGVRVQWQAPSAALREAARVSGLGAALRLG